MDSSKFKTPNGKYFTKQLFQEPWSTLAIDDRATKPTFSLHKDKPGLINFGKAYVQTRDPTGYKVAQELLGDYNLWTALMGCRWFLQAKEVWDRELDALLASEAIAEIQTLMKDGLPAQRLAAAKYMANHQYKQSKNTKGRPKREDIDRAARELAVSDREVAEDAERIRKAS